MPCFLMTFATRMVEVPCCRLERNPFFPDSLPSFPMSIPTWKGVSSQSSKIQPFCWGVLSCFVMWLSVFRSDGLFCYLLIRCEQNQTVVKQIYIYLINLDPFCIFPKQFPKYNDVWVKERRKKAKHLIPGKGIKPFKKDCNRIDS